MGTDNGARDATVGFSALLDEGQRSTGEPLPSWRVDRRRALRESTAVRGRGGQDGIRTLLLDMGGVVIPTLFESVVVPGFPEGPLRHDPDYRAVEVGRLPERDYWAQIAARLGGVDLGELWRLCSHVRTQWLAGISRIAGRTRIVAFTNDMERWFGPEWQDRFPELRFFDAVLEAGKLGKLKPDPEAFRLALSAIDERPERCLFVDDLEANIGVARSVGLQVELFDVRDPKGSVSRVVERLGLGVDDAARGSRVFSASRPSGRGGRADG